MAGPLQVYNVLLNGFPTQVMLTEAEAEKRGLTKPKSEPEQAPVEHKKRSPRTKAKRGDE